MDTTEFVRVEGAVVRGSDLRVHGSHVHSRLGLEQCIAMCAAAADCFALVHFDKRRLCAFKRSGGRVLHPAGSDVHERSDVYVRKAASTTATAPPQFAWRALVPRRVGERHRIFTVRDFVSAQEAAALRRFAHGCFERGAAQPHDPDHVTVGWSRCEASSSSSSSCR